MVDYDDHQNDSTERVLKAHQRPTISFLARRPSKRLDRASTERVDGWLHCASSVRPSKRLDRASTERIVGVVCTLWRGFDHQNDSTERVLKVVLDKQLSVEDAGPSKRLDRASTESLEFMLQLQLHLRPSKRLDRASTERLQDSLWQWFCVDHQNDSTERVLKEDA